MTSASRLNVRRCGFDTRRRQSAQAIDTRTITATTFCIAEIAAQSAPSSGRGQDRLDQAAGDDVGRPDRQQDEAPEDPACIRPARQVAEHPRLDDGVLDQAGEPRRDLAERSGLGDRGRRRGEDAEVAGHLQHEDDRRAPEEREDERVERDVLEDGERHALFVLVGLDDGARVGDRAGAGGSSMRPGGVVERPASVSRA